MANIGDIIYTKTADLIPYINNAKVHNEEQVAKLAASIREFGFLSPILIDKDNNVIAGHGRIMAAKKLKLENVPCLRVDGLTEAQKKAYILADNKLGELAGWDMDIVTSELEQLMELDFDLDLTGFDFNIDEPEPKEREDLSDSVKSTYEIIVECESELEQEETFDKLVTEGFKCRVLTL